MQARKGHAPYLKSFLKKLINENESNCSEVLDELYEQYAYLMTSMKVKACGCGCRTAYRLLF